MHYFKRNIGNYYKKAARLSMLEHGACTIIVDSCYSNEKFPTEQEAIKWCFARTQDEIDAVKFVLNHIFELVDGVYVHPEIQADLDKFKEKSEVNKQIALERENKKRTERERNAHDSCSNVNESAPNQRTKEPINQRTNKPKNNTQQAELFARFWSEYPRKDAKANASKAFGKLNPGDQLFEKIMSGLENHKRSQQWLKDGGQYVPHAATWLNQKRWEDVIDFNGIIHPGSHPESQAVASNENEIRHRKMLCAIALRDYEEAKKSGESDVMIGFLKTDYERALSSLRELCHD